MSKIIVANLKMNKNSLEMSEYLKKVTNEEFYNNIVILPSISNLFLSSIYENDNVEYGVQNFYFKEEGSFTGEVNLKMLKQMNVKYALVGHNERRKNFKESNAVINKKILNCLENDVTPILCIGESLGQTRNNLYKAHLKRQLSLALRGVKLADLNRVIIAYEPTFAVGADSSADLLYVENNIDLIKSILRAKSTKVEVAPKVLYGGSVNLENYKMFLNSEYIDGLLIGRSSLDVNNLIKMGRNDE